MKGKSTFIFSPSDTEYTVQLKKRCGWWCFLPLLLLLLLVKCNKTIEYQTIDAQTKAPLENSQVDVNISAQNYSESQTTNDKGKATFKVAKYPLYKIIFLSNSDSVITSASHEGYISKSFTSPLNSLTKKLVIIELDKYKSAHIVVIDSITRQPIEGVSILLETNNLHQTEISDNGGNVYFDSITFVDNQDAVISTDNPDYENVRRYYHIKLPKTIDDTIALLSIDDGGLRGGRGDITINLKWNSTDDLDLHLIDPCGERIYFDARTRTCSDGSGELDIDANAEDHDLIDNPQENIFWNDPAPGNYIVMVHFYRRRQLRKVPFTVTILQKSGKTTIDTIIPQTDTYVIVDTIKVLSTDLP